MRARHGLLAGVLLAGCQALLGCSPQAPSPQLATANACARQADREERAQDRDRLISDDQSLSPFSSSGLPDNPSQGLGALYDRDQAVDDCITRRSASTMGGTTIGLHGAE